MSPNLTSLGAHGKCALCGRFGAHRAGCFSLSWGCASVVTHGLQAKERKLLEQLLQLCPHPPSAHHRVRCGPCARNQDATVEASCCGRRRRHRRGVGVREAAGKGPLKKPHRCWAAPIRMFFLCLGNVFYFEVILDSRESWGDSSGRPCGPFCQCTHTCLT